VSALWALAASRAFAKPGELPLDRDDAPAQPSGVVPPPPLVPEKVPEPVIRDRVPLIVTDRFDLRMIDMDPRVGVRLVVAQVSRLDAMELCKKYNPPVMCVNDRGLGDLEKDLQIDTAPRVQLRYGTRLLVREAPRWNDVRFFLLEWECDGNGEIP
jgi:hypothetical protein